MNKKTKVLIIDDSATARKMFYEVVKSDVQNEIISLAFDPINALEKMNEEWPDLIILDIQMRRMNGLDFLKDIMSSRPTPIIICSSLVSENSELTLEAYDSGAFVVLKKPAKPTDIHFFSEKLLSSIRNARTVNMRPVKKQESKSIIERQVTKPVGLSKYERSAQCIIAIGASTGGTVATEKILRALPALQIAIVIVQHMPAGFTRAYANRINTLCEYTVSEAKQGEPLLEGCAYIAPGDSHMSIQAGTNGFKIKLDQEKPVNYHRPSVDVLFHSLAKCKPKYLMGVILTGMGNDGAEGMAAMKQVGAYNVAQDKETSVVFSMAREAIALNGVDEVIPVSEISEKISSFVGN